MEAQAQTVEAINAAQQTVAWYSGQVGVVAATWAVISLALFFIIYQLIKIVLKQKDEIAQLHVTCAQEKAQARIDADQAAQERVDIAWKRVDQIYQSVQALFAKQDATADKVSSSLQRLALVFASKGIIPSE